MNTSTEVVLKKVRRSFGNESSMKPRILKKWLQRLIERNDPEAMLIMSTLPFRLSDRTFSACQRDLVLRAANTGFAPAISHLAEFYYLENDFVSAYQLYEKAAKLGDSHALKVLSTAYEYGLDVCDKDVEKAKIYAEKAKQAKCWDPWDGYQSVRNTFD